MRNAPIDYFDFNLPYLTSPSTPKRFGEIYISAPTSPSTISEFDYFSISSPTSEAADHNGFTFFVEDSNKSPSSADEIFYGAKINHLKEDNNLLAYTKSPLVCPKHPSIIEQGNNEIHEDFSPIKKNESHNININKNPFGSSSRKKDSLMSYLLFFRKDKVGKGSCFSSTENSSLSSREKAISAHELHYARKKAEIDDLKKKTFLPFKHGILGRYSCFIT